MEYDVETMYALFRKMMDRDDLYTLGAYTLFAYESAGHEWLGLAWFYCTILNIA